MTKTEKIQKVKKLAIYLRISIKKTVMGKKVSKEETLENHKKRLVDYCEQHGYKWESFEEIVSGGKADISERPELENLLNRIDEFDGMLVNEISRIARNTYVASFVKNKMVAYKKLIFTPAKVFDLTDSNDAMHYNMISMIAEHEKAIISKRIRDDKMTMASNGLHASGSTPLGYIRNAKTRKLEIDPKTAHIVSTAFYLCNKGWGANRIQQYFNEIGYKTKQNKAFTIRAIKDMLKTETYKGFTIYSDHETVIEKDEKGNEIQRRKPTKTIISPGTHEPIIAPKIFDAIQNIRAVRGERYAGTREKPARLIPPSTIKDLLYCGCCKRKVKISYESKKKEHLIRRCIDILPDGSKCENSGMKAIAVEGRIFEEVLKYQEQLLTEIKNLQENDYETLEETQINEKERLEHELEQAEKEGRKLRRLKKMRLMEIMPDTEEEISIEELEEIEKDEEVQEITEDIDQNQKIISLIKNKLEKLVEKMKQPKIEEEIEKRLTTVGIIDQLKSETDTEKINNLYKRFIFKIHYKRVLPPEVYNLGSKNPIRKDYPATIKIEYI